MSTGHMKVHQFLELPEDLFPWWPTTSDVGRSRISSLRNQIYKCSKRLNHMSNHLREILDPTLSSGCFPEC